MESAYIRKPVRIKLVGFDSEVVQPPKKKPAPRKPSVTPRIAAEQELKEAKTSTKEDYSLPPEAIKHLAETAKNFASIFKSEDDTIPFIDSPHFMNDHHVIDPNDEHHFQHHDAAFHSIPGPDYDPADD